MKRKPPGLAGNSHNHLAVEVLESRNLLAVSSFEIEDVNPTSETFGDLVSPEDFEGQTSAWYFGHST